MWLWRKTGTAAPWVWPLSSRPRLPDGEWQAFGIRLTQLADHLAEQGIRLAYHHHMGTVIQSEPDLDRLLAAAPEIGLVLDPGHLAFAGIDPVVPRPATGR